MAGQRKRVIDPAAAPPPLRLVRPPITTPVAGAARLGWNDHKDCHLVVFPGDAPPAAAAHLAANGFAPADGQAVWERPVDRAAVFQDAIDVERTFLALAELAPAAGIPAAGEVPTRGRRLVKGGGR